MLGLVILGAGTTAATAGPFDPTQPPAMTPGQLPPHLRDRVQMPGAAAGAQEEPATPVHEDLRMVIQSGTYHPEVNGSAAFFRDAWYVPGQAVGEADLFGTRRHGADVDYEDGRHYVPVVDHGVEKTRRLPRDLPGEKAK
ncbi:MULTISPECIES: hypothetical protein [Halorhodospira]|uniref:hypothetical protein n=1 Tax=Halorhodospira TaxID=85108 RepID=UPI001EE96FEA|nr:MULTISPECIES: hypothetical protein [Halorhodospira]MCG5528645.1 hypothetical protein [Halorhodospira halophila]MCG5543972.1 hypothetical protein [Halorhodospira sp. 9628]